MSFPRHEGIFRSDGLGLGRSGAQSERLHAPTHRLDEFPTGYSSAGWSPPEPVSASPAEQKFTMKAAPQPSLFQRMGKPCLTGCLTAGVHRRYLVVHSQKPVWRNSSKLPVRPGDLPGRPPADVVDSDPTPLRLKHGNKLRGKSLDMLEDRAFGTLEPKIVFRHQPIARPDGGGCVHETF